MTGILDTPFNFILIELVSILMGTCHNPSLKKSLPFVLENGKFDKETVIITHSAGSPLALAVLENLKVEVKQAVLVAGFWRKLPPPGTNNVL